MNHVTMTLGTTRPSPIYARHTPCVRKSKQCGKVMHDDVDSTHNLFFYPFSSFHYDIMWNADISPSLWEKRNRCHVSKQNGITCESNQNQRTYYVLVV